MEDAPTDGPLGGALDKAKERLERLEHGRRTGLFVAAGRRFSEINGLDHSGLLAIELFTTVIPLIVIGFAYFTGFAENASVGNLIIRQMNVHGEMANTVRETFERSSQLKSVLTVTVVIGFLLWGIPMSLTVARVFERAWRRDPFPTMKRIGRGSLWFVVYLVNLIVAQRVSAIGSGAAMHTTTFIVSLVPAFFFWAVTPVILVRDGGKGWVYLAEVGLAGALLDALILRIAGGIVFPLLLSGWSGFGPIGVALALMTWCGVVGTCWVVTACFGAVLWERSAPIETVISAQTAAAT